MKDYVDFERFNCCKILNNVICGGLENFGFILVDNDYWLFYINLALFLVVMLLIIIFGIWSEIERRRNVLVVILIGIVLRVVLFIIIIKF